FIGALQRNESDPAVLARLCELDRVTSRLRRNAESLLVLTGRRGSRRSSEPVPVDEVLRSVLAEVEDHQRVELRVAGRAHVRGAVVAEVAHMLAELVENALVFSPPDARVEVVSRATEGECRVTIADYGAGMTAGELAAANARLRGEQSFLVAPTRCLGHHVVGRLAERLGVRVSLHASPGCGVTALMVLPEELLDARPAELLEAARCGSAAVEGVAQAREEALLPRRELARRPFLAAQRGELAQQLLLGGVEAGRRLHVDVDEQAAAAGLVEALHAAAVHGDDLA